MTKPLEREIEGAPVTAIADIGRGDGPHPVDRHVGLRIRMRRKEMSVSQERLAESLGITFQQVQKYERGANRVSASMLTRIAKTLGVPVAEMFGEASVHSGAVDEVAALLAEPGALELLKAYAGLPRGVSRSALVEFVRSLRQPG